MAGAVPRRLWDATRINKESRPAKGEGDGEVSCRARQHQMKVGTCSHSCQQVLMQTPLPIGRAEKARPPKLPSFLKDILAKCFRNDQFHSHVE